MKITNDSERPKDPVEDHRVRLVDPEERPPALSSLFRRSEKRNAEDVATQPSVYDDPQQAVYYQPHPAYENLHRFDPTFKWTWGDEKRLVRKLDWRVTLWAWIAFMALNLDQASLSQANADNFLGDLNMDTNDFNLGVTLFRVTFLLAEIPSQLISKKVGPDRWIPVLMVSWSIVAIAQFWLSGRTSFLVCRSLIGLLQGGFIPDLVLYLSYFFKGTELPFRLAILWTATRLSGVVAPLLAFGVLRLRGHNGLAGWRWLFLTEGLLNIVIASWSIFMMAPSPTQTKAWWRPKGWFTEEEEKVLVNRILRDDPSKGTMHNRQALTPKLLWESLCDYDIWPLYLLGLTFLIPASPPSQYLTLTLRQLGFGTLTVSLLTIPAQVGTTINMLLLTYISDKFRQKALMGILTQLWFLPCIIALAVLPADTNKWGTFALVTVLLSYPNPHPLQTAWCSRNSNSVRTRALSASLYNISVQLQSIIGSNIYREDDRPEYRRGNRVLIGIASLNIVLYALIKVYYTWRNRQRDKIWNSMTTEQKLQYLETTTDEGNKRLDFRFAS
ncbi:related to MFS transporter [Cephalotrichum gorgonifer]|uniref:Related to MFS transporter n=1 Tax=Cephalotrichum gorgonifer TaxID=2041049 RepID=A0AAE8N1Z7_9PEZI|nr:related to MFS transporter [Cephalotrichum gorgonifer]